MASSYLMGSRSATSTRRGECTTGAQLSRMLCGIRLADHKMDTA